MLCSVMNMHTNQRVQSLIFLESSPRRIFSGLVVGSLLMIGMVSRRFTDDSAHFSSFYSSYDRSGKTDHRKIVFAIRSESRDPSLSRCSRLCQHKVPDLTK